MQSKKVHIRIVNHSDHCLDGDNREDMCEGDNAEIGWDENMGYRFSFDPCAENSTPMMFETDGEMTRDGETVTIRFNTFITGIPGATVEYIFSEKDRKILTVVKRAAFEEVYFFDGESRRQQVMFNSDGPCLDLSVYTKSLDNRVTYEHGGFIEVEYYAEVRAGLAEHCKEYLLVESKI